MAGSSARPSPGAFEHRWHRRGVLRRHGRPLYNNVLVRFAVEPRRRGSSIESGDKDKELLEMLKSVRFVVDKDGRPSAVQVAMGTWEAILDRLEDIED